MRKTYPTDLSDEEWACIEPHLPTPKDPGRPRVHPLREILNAIFYIARSGCAWRLLPHEFAPWKTVFIIISGFGALMAPGKDYTLPCASDYGSASREILNRVRA
jgi:hypothetical protein